MKKALPWLGLLFLIALAAWCSIAGHTREESSIAWQHAQFRYPQVSREEVMANHELAKRLQASVPGAYEPDLEYAQQSEWENWKRQFEKGDADRQTRLLWQGRSETSQKQIIRDQLKTEAWLELQLAEQNSPITEAQARAWYLENAEHLRLPERYRVAHLFLSKHDPKKPNRLVEIQSLHERLSRGQSTFAQLTSKYSEDSRTRALGGDLGWVSASSRMPQDFIQAAAGLREGEISQPIETKLGWHILYLISRQSSRLAKFDDVRDEIMATLDQQRRERQLKAWR